MQCPFTTRHYPNLPTSQQAVQRLADEFNAAEREWERTHPVKPKRKARRKGRKTIEAVEPATTLSETGMERRDHDKTALQR